MSKALARIEEYFEAFCEKTEQCRVTENIVSADLQDAYSRLSRLRDRYLKEKSSLLQSERDALSKVFENDTFIKGMMDVRQVSEHVKKRELAVFRSLTNVPIELSSKVSAISMFAGKTVTLEDKDGKEHIIHHIKSLKEAVKRISGALEKT